MANTITLKILKAVQPIGELLLARVSYSDMLSMSKVDRRHISDNDEVLGIQRELRPDKVKQIEKYLSTIEATFPNTIIVNTSSKYIIDINEDDIKLKVTDSTFTIIDGQHRLEGFKTYKGAHFDLLVTIFVDLQKDQQADIFSTINSQQTKVDPSLNLNLGLDNKYYTPNKMIIEIAQSFNYDKESPWYGNIQMLGEKKQGIISLSAFARPLIDITYPERDVYTIKNALSGITKENINDMNYNTERYLFWEFYKSSDKESVYKILWNFFTSMKAVFEKDWMGEDSILNKTTGYNAMIRLFRDLAVVGLHNGTLSQTFFAEQLQPLRSIDGTVNSSNYGSSGQYSSSLLYKDMKGLIPSLQN